MYCLSETFSGKGAEAMKWVAVRYCFSLTYTRRMQL